MQNMSMETDESYQSFHQPQASNQQQYQIPPVQPEYPDQPLQPHYRNPLIPPDHSLQQLVPIPQNHQPNPSDLAQPRNQRSQATPPTSSHHHSEGKEFQDDQEQEEYSEEERDELVFTAPKRKFLSVDEQVPEEKKSMDPPPNPFTYADPKELEKKIRSLSSKHRYKWGRPTGQDSFRRRLSTIDLKIKRLLEAYWKAKHEKDRLERAEPDFKRCVNLLFEYKRITGEYIEDAEFEEYEQSQASSLVPMRTKGGEKRMLDLERNKIVADKKRKK